MVAQVRPNGRAQNGGSYQLLLAGISNQGRRCPTLRILGRLVGLWGVKKGGMMGYNDGHTSSELWAVLDTDSNVVWTRGGSSTKPRLMVYESKKKAHAALRSNWTAQVHADAELRIEKIYPCE